MRTDQFIDLLARQAGAAPRWHVQSRLAMAAILGTLASVGAVFGLLGLNPGLAALGAALEVKLAYVVGLMIGSAYLADRLARPAAPWRGAARNLVLVLLLMTAVAALTLSTAPPGERLALLLGQSWTSCTWRVAALSIPALGATLWAMHGLAPTQPRMAGFAAGLLAGSVGALGYALFCTELSPVFVVTWYSVGIIVPACVGALVGPAIFKW